MANTENQKASSRKHNQKRYKDSEYRKWQREYKKTWNYKNKDAVARYYKRLRVKVLNHYGHKCACCGEDRYEFLAIDHKNGDGNKHRKEIKGTNVCLWIIRNDYPDDLQILCHNCNMAKTFYGVCPHKKKARA